MADDIAERIKIDIAERIRRLPELANLPGGALGADCFEAAMEIEALRAENAKLRAFVESIAKQKMASEVGDYMRSFGDFEYAYDCFIKDARAAMGESDE